MCTTGIKHVIAEASTLEDTMENNDQKTYAEGEIDQNLYFLENHSRLCGGTFLQTRVNSAPPLFFSFTFWPLSFPFGVRVVRVFPFAVLGKINTVFAGGRYDRFAR